VSQFQYRIRRTIKTIVRRPGQMLRQRVISTTAPRITRAEIVSDLKRLGIHEGDTILVYSSLKSLGYVEGGAQTVIRALIEAVSSNGTLIIPTFHMIGGTMYRTCLTPNYVFDPKKDGTSMGAIPQAFLKFPGICRSIHPTHSVSAIGKYAGHITEAHHLGATPFDIDSPWDRLMKLDGKLVGLGTSVHPITLYIMLEYRMGDEFPLPVMMSTTHLLKCRSWDGTIVEVPVTPRAPEYMARRIDHGDREDLRRYFWREFERAGLLKVRKVGEATSWWMSAQQCYDHLVRLMREGITIYSTSDELKRRPIPESF